MPGFVILIILAVIAIIVAAVYFEKERRIKRAIRAVPKVALADGRTGVVRVAGQLSYAAQPLSAPLSGRACAYYEVRVEEWRSNGKSGSWRVLIREVLGQPFLLQDPSGRAFVHLDASSEIVVNKDFQDKSGTFNDAKGHLEAFLARHGQSSTGLLGFNKKLRYLEGVLEAGETVTVVGVASREPDPTPNPQFSGYREQPTWMVVRRGPERGLLVSDDPSLAS